MGFLRPGVCGRLMVARWQLEGARNIPAPLREGNPQRRRVVQNCAAARARGSPAWPGGSRRAIVWACTGEAPMERRIAKAPARRISAAEAAALVRNGMWVDYGLGLIAPDVFDKALGARVGELSD